MIKMIINGWILERYLEKMIEEYNLDNGSAFGKSLLNFMNEEIASFTDNPKGRKSDPLLCRVCFFGRYTKYDVLGDNSKEYFCSECGHVKKTGDQIVKDQKIREMIQRYEDQLKGVKA